MQRILSNLRKACKEYSMIKSGDVIAVGVSGGKDSLLLLRVLAAFRRFSPESFDLKAITVDMRFGGKDSDLSYIGKQCGELGVPYEIVKTDIAQIVFDVRREESPCSLCANMRRGALINAAKESGCNVLALAHSMDDAAETFLMNLFLQGRIGCFSPVTEYGDSGVRLIRPLILCEEKEIISSCRRNSIEPQKSLCPADKHTKRQEIKLWIQQREHTDKGFKRRIFGAVRRNGMDGWAIGGETENYEDRKKR